MNMNTFFSLSLLSILFLGSGLALAKEIDLFDQPMVGAKTIGKVDLSAGIIPIFTQKDGKWIKVGDPRNGNTGWVPASALETNPHTSFSFTQKVIDEKDKTKSSYQVFEFGTPKALTPEQKKSLEQLQKQQQALQQSIQKNMQELIQNMNNLYKNQILPMVMPVIVVPRTEPVKK